MKGNDEIRRDDKKEHQPEGPTPLWNGRDLMNKKNAPNDFSDTEEVPEVSSDVVR